MADQEYLKKEQRGIWLKLIPTVRNGFRTFRFSTLNDMQDKFLDNWAYKLAREYSYRTVKAYCYAIKSFLTYIFGLIELEGGVSSQRLQEALNAYESYLVFGVKSDSDIAKKVAILVGSPGLAAASVVSHLAAVNKFIDASEQLHRALDELESKGAIFSRNLTGFSLEASVGTNVTSIVRAALKRNTWLGACLAGGANRIKRAGLRPVSKQPEIAYMDEFGGDEKTFPIDKCVELIDSATSLRDKVLWSLLSASGCRISEALIMLKEDIDLDPLRLDKKKVYVVNPNTRRNELIEFLSETTINQLSFKGRDKPDTFLIEPFASLFWKFLAEYLQDEKRKDRLRGGSGHHRFLIRNLINGGPMCLSYQALLERFQKAAFKVAGNNYGFHSLRHMYGYYLANHCPNPNANSRRAYGLDLHMVKEYMGHRDVNTTRKYAREDVQMLHATLAASNLIRMGGGPQTVRQTQIAFLKQELLRLENMENAG
ncbi:tyrosine-type recombinase/integrase [Pseudomonas alloputida]|uniref:tyrosine-type recombinase/integrase n=1 Tax=Pseudomonas alloputida TaxID=1940621 RepID=UPI0038678851